MFGIFGGGIPTAQSLLNPFNIAGVPLNSNIYNPYSYIPQPQPVAQPVQPTANNTYYADYRNLTTPAPMKVNTNGVGSVNTSLVNYAQPTSLFSPNTLPNVQYNWGAPTVQSVVKTPVAVPVTTKPAAKTAVPLLVKK